MAKVASQKRRFLIVPGELEADHGLEVVVDHEIHASRDLA
jgi:hypothetical protein